MLQWAFNYKCRPRRPHFTLGNQTIRTWRTDLSDNLDEKLRSDGLRVSLQMELNAKVAQFWQSLNALLINVT